MAAIQTVFSVTLVLTLLMQAIPLAAQILIYTFASDPKIGV